MTRKTIGIAVAIAIGTLSTTATALTPFGNNSQKGSLLIYARIDVQAGNDTLITLTNDSAAAVRVKCYYATSDQIPTPYSGTAESARTYKHFKGFAVDLTHNQPFSWWASNGQLTGTTKQIAPPFGHFDVFRDVGEMKCWAITNDALAELSYNHLYGTASVINASTGQAWEYTASAFQALAPTGAVSGSPGSLFLDNISYDACPNMLMGNFNPGNRSDGGTGEPESDAPAASQAPPDPLTQVTLVSCNQDLRQNYTPTLTKLTWTFWNEDESPRTGNHYCADSWYETNFPSSDPLWYDSTYDSLGTESAYFRIETTADTSICGPSATTSAYVGVIRKSLGAAQTRGTNLTQRGSVAGVIKYNVDVPDSFKK